MLSSDLCDTCRQNRAIRHWIDAEQPGQLIDRQVCAMCLGLSESEAACELPEYLLAVGKCQFCGAPAFSVSGVPGPKRVVACSECEKKRLSRNQSP